MTEPAAPQSSTGQPAVETHKPARCVLIADPDKAFGEQVAAAFRATGTLRPLLATTTDAALEALAVELCAAVITDPGATRVNAYRVLASTRGGAAARIPVLFSSTDTRLATKLDAFRHGATDFVGKPAEPAEIVARIESAVAGRDARKPPARRRRNLAGDFVGMAFTDLVHLLQIGNRTGELTVLAGGGSGQITFISGAIYHATFGNLEGEEAFYRFMYEQEGQFEFEAMPIDPNTTRNTIAIAPTALLMEGARRFDAWRREGGAPPESYRDRIARPSELAPLTEAAGRTPDPAATAGLVDLVAALPPEIHVLPREELSEFTRPDDRMSRFLVHVLGDPGEIVHLLLGAGDRIAMPQVEAGLALDEKIVGARWQARGDQCADLLVFDQDRPSQFIQEIASFPAAYVVAPLDGDWLTLPVGSIVEMQAMLAHLRPAVVVGIGDVSVEAGLGGLLQRIGRTDPPLILPRRDGGGSTLLCDWMRHALERWLAAASNPEQPADGDLALSGDKR